MTQPPYGQPDPYSQQPYGQNPYGQPVSDPYALPPGRPANSPYALPPGQPMSGPPGSGPPYPQTYQLPVSGVPTSGGYDPYGQAYAQQAYAPQAYLPQPYAQVNYGYDPATGQPYSDKSKLAAGLLQLLLGGLLVLGGIGRLYAGNIALGVVQLVLSVAVGWTAFWCGLLFIFPLVVPFGLWVWFVVDGIMLLAGRPVDGQGRPLRPS